MQVKETTEVVIKKSRNHNTELETERRGFNRLLKPQIKIRLNKICGDHFGIFKSGRL